MTSRRAIETFAPTGGRVLGVITLLLGVLVIVDILLEWRTAEGLTAGLVVVAVGTLVWMGLIRPSVAAYDDVLVLRNIVTDFWIPWHLVESAEVTPTLTVHAGGSQYRSVAIGASGADRRAAWRARRRMAEQATPLSPPTGASAVAGEAERAPSAYAVSRIEALAAKHAENSKQRSAVERRWVWTELLVFAVSALLALAVGMGT